MMTASSFSFRYLLIFSQSVVGSVVCGTELVELVVRGKIVSFSDFSL